MCSLPFLQRAAIQRGRVRPVTHPPIPPATIIVVIIMLSSSSATMAVLLPAALQPLVVDGGAELVVERRAGGRKRLFMRLPDEAERRQRAAPEHTNPNTSVNASANVNAHQHALEQLRWARATLWHDDRLQRYLRTADYMTWPPVAELTTMVDLVCSAKETDDVPDFVSATALKRAVMIVAAEDLYPGLHPLKEETLTGKLLVFASTSGDGCAVGETLHEVNASRQEKENKQENGSTTSSVWVIDLNTQSFSLDEIIRLQLTASVQEECVKVMRPSLANAGFGNSWGDMVAVHRRSTGGHCVGLFCSIPDCITQLGMEVNYLARAVSSAAEQGCRVRLRLGVYLTLLQRSEVYVIIRSPQQGIGVENEEEVRETFEGKTKRNFLMCSDAGLLLHASEGEDMENVLRSRFLSPLASEHRIAESVPLTPFTRVTHVVVEHNPIAIIHGPRVTGAFPENNEARADLLELLASREGVTSTRTQQEQQQRDEEQNTTGVMAFSSSLALTGERLRCGVDEAVFKTLSQEPMTRAALSAHVNMSRFRGLSNFDAILKDSLKRNAEYRGNKYYLRD